jgi:multiple sugar transport system permease protein
MTMLNRVTTRTLVVALIVVVLALYVFPYLYLVLTSIKPPIETIAIPPTVFPSEIRLDSYERIFSDALIQKSFLNSLVVATGSTVLSLLFAVPAAYGISRFNFGLGRLFIVAVLVTRMVPYVSVAIPFFALMRALGWSDTYQALILAHTTVTLPLAIWLMASFFEGMPTELEEAARVDGCNRVTAFIRIILPLVAGGIAVTAIFAFLASWNEFLFALLLTSVEAKTTPVVISEFKTQYGLEWGTMTALGVLYTLPVILVALVLQRRIVGGLTMGAVKG